MPNRFVCVFTISSIACLAPTAFAAEGGWTFSAAPFFWAAGLDGQIGKGAHAADVDASFSDIWENLDIGVLGQFEAHNGPIGLVLSPVYMKLSASGDAPAGFVDGEADSETTIVELYATLEMTPGIEILAGGRYTQLDNEIQLELPNGNDASRTASNGWWDPMVGARYRLDLSEKWTLALRYDVGGFGVESDLVWSANVLVGYRVRPDWTVLGGFRSLDYDYEEDGTDGVVWDVRMEGPVIGLNWVL